MGMRPRNKFVAQIVVAGHLAALRLRHQGRRESVSPRRLHSLRGAVELRALAGLVRRHDERDQLHRRPRRFALGTHRDLAARRWRSSPSVTVIRNSRSCWPRSSAARSASCRSTTTRRRSSSATRARCSSATCSRPSRSSGRPRPRLRSRCSFRSSSLALPILDTAVTIVRRTTTGQKITEGDRGHFHHQLVFRFGLNVRQAVLLIYVLCAALGVVAFLLSGGVASLRLAQAGISVMAGAPP